MSIFRYAARFGRRKRLRIYRRHFLGGGRARFKMSRLRRRFRGRRRFVRRRGRGIPRFINLTKGYGRSLTIALTTQQTIPNIATDASADDAYYFSRGTYATTPWNLVHSGAWPPNSTGPLNDVRFWLNDTWGNQLDNKTGLLPAYLTAFSHVQMVGLRVKLIFEPTNPTLSNPLANNFALFIGQSDINQTAAAQSIVNNYNDYLRLMPRKYVKIRYMPSSIIGSNPTQRRIAVSWKVNYKALAPSYFRENTIYYQAITGQQGLVGSVGINAPTTAIGYLQMGIMTKDGTNMNTSTVQGRFTVRCSMLLRLTEPMVWGNL